MKKWKTYAPNRLGELVKSGRAIYILNSSLMPTGTKGSIIINFIDGTRKKHFTVPDTFIPLCITDSIPADQLLSSSDFLALLNKRIITLVNSDQAESYLESEEANDEYEAIVLSQHSAQARGVSLESATKRTFSSAASLTMDVEEAITDADISPKVRAIVDDITNNGITGKQFLSECKRHGEGFSEVDLYHIKENVKDLDVQKWVEAKLFDHSGDMQGVANKNKNKKVVSSLSREINNKRARAAKNNDSEEPTTPEEEAELQAGMAKAMQNQAIGGKSKIPEMANQMINGK